MNLKFRNKNLGFEYLKLTIWKLRFRIKNMKIRNWETLKLNNLRLKISMLSRI